MLMSIDVIEYVDNELMLTCLFGWCVPFACRHSLFMDRKGCSMECR